MTAQTFRMISTVGFILAAVFCALALVIWFRFGIWKIIGDLSGRTARKSVERMRRENEESGKKSFRPTPAAMNRGKITYKIEPAKEQTEMSGEKTVLLKNVTEILEKPPQTKVSFRMIQDIVLIHTQEEIPRL